MSTKREMWKYEHSEITILEPYVSTVITSRTQWALNGSSQNKFGLVCHASTYMYVQPCSTCLGKVVLVSCTAFSITWIHYTCCNMLCTRWIMDAKLPCWCSIKWMQAMQRSLLWAHSRRKIVGTSTTTLVYGWTFNAWTHWWLRPCGRFRRRDSGMRAYGSRSLSSTTPASLPVVVCTACAVLLCAPLQQHSILECVGQSQYRAPYMCWKMKPTS